MLCQSASGAAIAPLTRVGGRAIHGHPAARVQIVLGISQPASEHLCCLCSPLSLKFVRRFEGVTSDSHPPVLANGTFQFQVPSLRCLFSDDLHKVGSPAIWPSIVVISDSTRRIDHLQRSITTDGAHRRPIRFQGLRFTLVIRRSSRRPRRCWGRHDRLCY